jgi:hypothetical protein
MAIADDNAFELPKLRSSFGFEVSLAYSVIYDSIG